jgi:hypothetical protein
MKSVCALAVAFLLIASVVPVVGGQSPAKATGGIQFYMNDESGNRVRAWVEFEAHLVTPDGAAKGQARYHDAQGNKLTVNITCIAVWDDYAVFSGPVVSTNVDEWTGKWFTIWVRDGGSPGTKGDQIGGQTFDADPGCAAGSAPAEWSPVTAGDLVVHP